MNASWLPERKRAAVCLSVDDVHPASSSGSPNADRALRAFEHLRWLQERHPQLQVTLFTTPDWRSLAPRPSGSLLTRIPLLRSRVYQVPVLRAGTLLLERHPAFCAELRGWSNAEVAIHGLHHVTRGPQPVLEFKDKSAAQCRAMLAEALRDFEGAGLQVVRGVCPPGWHATPELIAAMDSMRFTFIASARDLDTPVSSAAVTAGSGLRGMPLIHPHRIAGTRLLHFTTNYQATSQISRALEITRAGGLLAIKAHLLDSLGDYRALDGLTESYRDQLHDLLLRLEDEHGDALWWTSMGEIAARAEGAAS